MPSEEELEALRKKNDSLRDQLVSAQQKQAENDAERVREHEAAELMAENARLEAQLARAKEAAKVSVSREGAANIMAATADQIAAAQAALDQPSGVVDVNDPENMKKKDTGSVKATPEGKEAPPVDTGTAPAPSEKNGGNS